VSTVAAFRLIGIIDARSIVVTTRRDFFIVEPSPRRRNGLSAFSVI
jgi:hypothetical protein